MSALAAKEGAVLKRYAERPVLTLPGGRDVFRLTEKAPPGQMSETAKLDHTMRAYYAWVIEGPDVWASGASRSNWPSGETHQANAPLHTRGPGKAVEADHSLFLRVEAALNALSPAQRMMLHWRYANNLHFKEIATRLSMTVNQIDRWWREATVKLYYAIHPDLNL